VITLIRRKTFFQKEVEAERYILSTMPVLYAPLWKRDGSIFISDDAYGHKCTVTGALKTLQGRWFDRSDDKIQATSSLFSGTRGSSVKTISFWVYTPSSTGYGNIIATRDAGGSNWQLTRDNNTLNLTTYNTGDGAQDTTYDFVVGKWVYLTTIIDGPANTHETFANGIYVGVLSRNFGTDDGGTVLSIGTDNVGGFASGTIGELIIWNRRLTRAEDQQNYLATKWRYQ